MQELGIRNVGDLMVGAGVWNKDSIEFIFCPDIVAQILSITLHLHGGDDAMFWPRSIDGHYSSKLDYAFIKSIMATASASSSSSGSSLPSKIWNNF